MKELLNIYPFSLALRLFEDEEQALNLCLSNLPAALGLLAEKEADILQKRFRDKMTLKEISIFYGVSQSRIRQREVKALQKLRYYKNVNLLIAVPKTELIKEQEKYQRLERDFSVLEQDYKELVAKIELMTDKRTERNETATAEETPIEYLDLSMRSHNALSRAGIKTLRDITNLSMRDLLQIQNLGKTSVSNIEWVLKQYGMKLRKE